MRERERGAPLFSQRDARLIENGQVRLGQLFRLVYIKEEVGASAAAAHQYILK